jgi:type VI secretion system protein ImpE
VELRADNAARAGELAAEAERVRPAVHGAAGSQPFADFRDLDDLLTGVFEVLTRTGKYYWIPTERVELLEFKAPERPLDVFWRTVRMVVRDAFDAEVHMPAIYGTTTGADDACRLGRRTDWVGAEPAPLLGLGQRVFLLDGEREAGVMELSQVTFED